MRVRGRRVAQLGDKRAPKAVSAEEAAERVKCCPRKRRIGTQHELRRVQHERLARPLAVDAPFGEATKRVTVCVCKPVRCEGVCDGLRCGSNARRRLSADGMR